MIHHEYLKATPWDAKCLGIDTFEIIELNKDILESIGNKPGHYTVRIDPLASSKQLLNQFGFYYCDTLIKAVILKKRYNHFDDNHVSLISTNDASICKKITLDSFQFDRFHRDFNIDRTKADLRYLNWIEELCSKHHTCLFCYNNETAGFIAYDKNRLILAAIAKPYRGRGLAKCFWSSICNKIFSDGYEEIFIDISSVNLPILNLYVSLGATFRNAVEVYHKIVEA